MTLGNTMNRIRAPSLLLLLLIPTLASSTPLVRVHPRHPDQRLQVEEAVQPLALAQHGVKDELNFPEAPFVKIVRNDEELETALNDIKEARPIDTEAQPNHEKQQESKRRHPISRSRCNRALKIVDLVEKPICIPRKGLECRLRPTTKLVLDHQQPICTAEAGCSEPLPVVRRVVSLKRECRVDFRLQCRAELVEVSRIVCVDHLDQQRQQVQREREQLKKQLQEKTEEEQELKKERQEQMEEEQREEEQQEQLQDESEEEEQELLEEELEELEELKEVHQKQSQHSLQDEHENEEQQEEPQEQQVEEELEHLSNEESYRQKLSPAEVESALSLEKERHLTETLAKKLNNNDKIVRFKTEKSLSGNSFDEIQDDLVLRRVPRYVGRLRVF